MPQAELFTVRSQRPCTASIGEIGPSETHDFSIEMSPKGEKRRVTDYPLVAQREAIAVFVEHALFHRLACAQSGCFALDRIQAGPGRGELRGGRFLLLNLAGGEVTARETAPRNAAIVLATWARCGILRPRCDGQPVQDERRQRPKVLFRIF